MRHAAEVARFFAAPYVRIFSFFLRPGAKPAAHRDEVIDRMRALTRIAPVTGGASGALIGMYGAAPAGRPVEDWDSAEQIGAFDGTMRRHQAVGGMLRQNFNRFLFSLRDAELLRIRLAVPCADLNPGGYGTAVFASTSEVVGYDCPVGRSRVVNQQRPWF